MLTYPEPTFTLQGTPYLEYLPVVDVLDGPAPRVWRRWCGGGTRRGAASRRTC